MHQSLTFWVAFNVFVLLMLALDLGVFHRENKAMRFREALGWSLFWAGLAAAFAVLVSFTEGYDKSIKFVTGYVIEESLSVDNLFVFLALFQFFRVPEELQYKGLFWGIIGALLMRGVFIVAGVALLQRFSWIIFLFGGFLVFTAIRMFWRRCEHSSPESSFLLRWAQRRLRVTGEYEGDRFFVRRNTELYATPLFLVLLLIEGSDLLFAVDSIPAVLAISRDAFIVYTSNVFAILGLRALFFALSGVMQRFRYAGQAVAAILLFVGAKMLASPWFEIPTEWSLAIIAFLLAAAVAASLAFSGRAASIGPRQS